MLDWLVHERGIELHTPAFDKSKRADDRVAGGCGLVADLQGPGYRC